MSRKALRKCLYNSRVCLCLCRFLDGVVSNATEHLVFSGGESLLPSTIARAGPQGMTAASDADGGSCGQD